MPSVLEQLITGENRALPAKRGGLSASAANDWKKQAGWFMDAKRSVAGERRRAPESTGAAERQSGLAVDHLFCEQKRAQTSQRAREHRTTQSSNQSFNHSNDVNMTRVNERVSD